VDSRAALRQARAEHVAQASSPSIPASQVLPPLRS
jgi:hypothetical protein